jgi:hypothetical protein
MSNIALICAMLIGGAILFFAVFFLVMSLIVALDD